MVFWIKRLASILSIISFFVVFTIGLDPSQPFDPQILAMSFFKAALSAVLFWFAGFVLGDIVVKGLVSAIPTREEDAIEGGLLQRIYDEKKKLDPDSSPKDQEPVDQAGQNGK